ncbi:MAG: hypothetical protein LBI43_02100 [Streptococcaceae bacterium]|jgi:hypothetical protein|nr:hypothetical protein [Streptococcaceae bacterium]
MENNVQIQLGRYPSPEELKAVQPFLLRGDEVIFLAESRGKGIKTADVQISGVIWEIKCPSGNSKQTITRQLRRAIKQSPNIIIDSRFSKIKEKDFENQLKIDLRIHTSIARLILITKQGKILDLKK